MSRLRLRNASTSPQQMVIPRERDGGRGFHVPKVRRRWCILATGVGAGAKLGGTVALKRPSGYQHGLPRGVDIVHQKDALPLGVGIWLDNERWFLAGHFHHHAAADLDGEEVHLQPRSDHRTDDDAPSCDADHELRRVSLADAVGKCGDLATELLPREPDKLRALALHALSPEGLNLVHAVMMLGEITRDVKGGESEQHLRVQ